VVLGHGAPRDRKEGDAGLRRIVGRPVNRAYRAYLNFLSLRDYLGCGRYYSRNLIRSIVRTVTGPYDPLPSSVRTFLKVRNE
jgi:hypothetical protein